MPDTFRFATSREILRGSSRGEQGASAEAPSSTALRVAEPGPAAPLVVLIDRRPLNREALHRLLASELRELELRSFESAADLAGVPEPEKAAIRVVLLSLHTDEDLATRLRAALGPLASILPEAPVIALGDSENPEHAHVALANGVNGYIPANTRISIIAHVINLVLAGGVYCPADAWTAREVPTEPEGEAGPVAPVVAVPAPPPTQPGVTFSKRQREILELLCLGLPNKVIAYRLGIVESTVKVHLKNIMRKLNLTSRTQVALYALSLQERAPPHERD
jgi:DNA-binding NarL/FixJ family response regulator